MKAKKKYGQNFLKNEEIIKNITDLVNPNENDLIIEIGPGRGALTKYLIKKNCDLVCIEIDTDLKFYLDKYQSKKCKIIYEDILKVDFKEITKNYQNIYVVGNLPYYITSPIIEHLINNIKSKKMVFVISICPFVFSLGWGGKSLPGRTGRPCPPASPGFPPACGRGFRPGARPAGP